MPSILNRLLKVPEDEVTPEELYLSRRTFMRAAASLVVGTAAAAALGQGAGAADDELTEADKEQHGFAAS